MIMALPLSDYKGCSSLQAVFIAVFVGKPGELCIVNGSDGSQRLVFYLTQTISRLYASTELHGQYFIATVNGICCCILQLELKQTS